MITSATFIVITPGISSGLRMMGFWRDFCEGATVICKRERFANHRRDRRGRLASRRPPRRAH